MLKFKNKNRKKCWLVGLDFYQFYKMFACVSLFIFIDFNDDPMFAIGSNMFCTCVVNVLYLIQYFSKPILRNIV